MAYVSDGELQRLRELEKQLPPVIRNRKRKEDDEIRKKDRVEHKDRGLGTVLEINDHDAIFHISWDKEQSYNDGVTALGLPATTTTHSWVGRTAIKKVLPTYSLYEDLDYAGFPPGWKESFMGIFNERLEDIRPLVQAVIAKNTSRSDEAYGELVDAIFHLVVHGDGNAQR
jgi:hypothetical protein